MFYPLHFLVVGNILYFVDLRILRNFFTEKTSNFYFINTKKTAGKMALKPFFLRFSFLSYLLINLLFNQNN